MRRYLFFYILLAAFIAFGTNNLVAQTPKVEFDKAVHDFGDIMITSGHHSCTFTFKNIGEQPVIIQTVISSCGCTNPVWTKSPVLPGKTGKIDVTFLNDQGPYPFDKSITIYISGEQRPVVLRIKGVVHDKPKTLKELFPEQFGDVSFRRSSIDLGNIAQGDTKSETIEVANTSNRSVDISFANLSKGLSVTSQPSKIAAGSKAEVKIVINTKEAKNWGNTQYRADIAINASIVQGKSLRVSANIRDNFSSYTKEQMDNAPLPMAVSSSYDFGKIKAGGEVKHSFTIRNLGRSNLLIHKVDSGDKRVTAKHPSKIEPGKTGNIEVTINTAGDSGDKGMILSVITNSPTRPVFNLIITGNISK